MATVNGVAGATVELTDSLLLSLQKLRMAQANYAATIRGAAVPAGSAGIITTWQETNTNGGQLSVTLTIPVTVSATADGYSVSADVAFDDGV